MNLRIVVVEQNDETERATGHRLSRNKGVLERRLFLRLHHGIQLQSCKLHKHYKVMTSLCILARNMSPANNNYIYYFESLWDVETHVLDEELVVLRVTERRFKRANCKILTAFITETNQKPDDLIGWKLYKNNTYKKHT